MVVAAADVAETKQRKLVANGHYQGKVDEVDAIPWPAIKAVIHVADPACDVIQLDIETKAQECQIPILRLEDIPGAVIRSSLANPGAVTPVYESGIRYLVINKAGRLLAEEEGVLAHQIFEVGIPDFSLPTQDQTEEWQRLVRDWKMVLGCHHSKVIFYSCTSTLAVDKPGLEMVIEIAKKIGAVLIVAPHPKVFKEYPKPYSGTAQEMMRRGQVFLDFFEDQGFTKLTNEPWCPREQLLFVTGGIGQLRQKYSTLGTDGFPPDLVPADLVLSAYSNIALFNSVWGTPGFNLVTPQVQAEHNRSVGSRYPLAVASRLLPGLERLEDFEAVITAALENPADHVVSAAKFAEAVPLVGGASVDRIVQLVEDAVGD